MPNSSDNNNKYKIPEIKASEDTKHDEYYIPENAVNSPIDNNKPYYISFEDYLTKKCGLYKITKSGHLHKIIDWLKTIYYDISEIESKGQGDRIKNLNNYKFLFNGFANPEEIDMREFVVSKGDGIRIFYYIDNEAKLLNIRLITHKHINID